MAHGGTRPYKLYVWWINGKVRSFKTKEVLKTAYENLSDSGKIYAELYWQPDARTKRIFKAVGQTVPNWEVVN